MNAILRQNGNYAADCYVGSVQEPFMIVGLVAEAKALRMPIEAAFELADRLARMNKGLVTYTVEF
jgi:hypothetical protein